MRTRGTNGLALRPPKDSQMPSDATSSDEPTAGNARAKLPSPEEYAEFINGVELLDVRLVSSEATSEAIKPEVADLSVHVLYTSTILRSDATEPFEFEARPTLEVTARKEGVDEPVGMVKVCLGLLYRSLLEPTDGYLEIFSKVNLQVNAWPYLREYVQQTVTRFGWAPLVLPTLKTASATKPRAKRT